MRAATYAYYTTEYIAIHYRHDKKQWYAKQKHLGCKKRWGQSEAAVIWLYMQLKALISAKAKN